MYFLNKYTGLFLFTKDDTKTDKLNYAYRALRVINPDFRVNLDSNLVEGKLKIVVGYR